MLKEGEAGGRWGRVTLPRPIAAMLLAAALLLVPAAAQTHPVVRVLASGGWKALPVVGAELRVEQDGRVVARGRTGARGNG